VSLAFLWLLLLRLVEPTQSQTGNGIKRDMRRALLAW
jgi:hypothetical protein